MWMDIVLFLRTVISPVWQQGSGNPECWSWVWVRRRRRSRLFPHCNQFKYLDLLYRNQQEEEKKEDLATAAEAKKSGNSSKQSSSGSRKNKDLKRVRKAINAIIEKFSDEEGWLSSGQLGDQLGKRLPGFDVRKLRIFQADPLYQISGNYETGRIPQEAEGESRSIPDEGG